MIKVVAAVIENNAGNILIARRASHKSMAGKWEFPGGKIEPNESEQDALRRELLEEFSITTKIGNHILSVEHSYDSFTIELISYYARHISGSFNLKDHDKIEWVPRSNLKRFDLAEADIPIADELNKK